MADEAQSASAAPPVEGAAAPDAVGTVPAAAEGSRTSPVTSSTQPDGANGPQFGSQESCISSLTEQTSSGRSAPPAPAGGAAPQLASPAPATSGEDHQVSLADAPQPPPAPAPPAGAKSADLGPHVGEETAQQAAKPASRPLQEPKAERDDAEQKLGHTVTDAPAECEPPSGAPAASSVSNGGLDTSSELSGDGSGGVVVKPQVRSLALAPPAPVARTRHHPRAPGPAPFGPARR